MEKNKEQKIVMNPNDLIRLYNQLINVSIYMHQASAHSLRHALRQLYMSKGEMDISDFFFILNDSDESRTSVENGIGTIKINGPIYNDDPEDWAVKSGYVSSYKAIRNDFDEMMNDKDVKVVKFYIGESPGGIGLGLFDLMDDIYNARGLKPIISQIDNYGFSAAQGLASAADQTWINRSTMAGSVGSIIIHEDITEMLKQDGISVETFVYGKKKDQGASFKPLSNDAKEEYQADVNMHGEEFTKLVARNLNKPFKAIKSLEAGTFSGQDAVDVGLAHKIIPGHMVDSQIVSEFSLTSKPKNKGVQNKMDIETLKTEHPETYQAIFEERKSSVKIPDTKENPETDAKITELSKTVEAQGKVIEAQDAKLKDYDKVEAIRAEKETQVKADNVWLKALAKSKIPENLHEKVMKGLSHGSFKTEDGVFDKEAFSTAIDEEIKDWEERLEDKSGDPKIQGVGSGDGGDDKTEKKAEEIKNTVSSLASLAGLKVPEEK